MTSKHPKWCECAICDPEEHVEKLRKKKGVPREKSKDKLRQMRRSEEVAIEAYLGKNAIAATYEQMGIEVPKDLKKRVNDKRTQLKYRGAL